MSNVMSIIGLGLTITGEYLGEELQKPFDSQGTQVQNKVVLLKIGAIDTVSIEVPKEYKIEKDTKGLVSLPVKTTARQWDNVNKKFNYVDVRFYVPRPSK